MFSKNDYIKAFESTEKEWETFSPKQKSKKILEHLRNIKDESKDEQQKKNIDDKLIMIEELDAEMIESYLDELHEIVMEKARKELNLD